MAERPGPPGNGIRCRTRTDRVPDQDRPTRDGFDVRDAGDRCSTSKGFCAQLTSRGQRQFALHHACEHVPDGHNERRDCGKVSARWASACSPAQSARRLGGHRPRSTAFSSLGSPASSWPSSSSSAAPSGPASARVAEQSVPAPQRLRCLAAADPAPLSGLAVLALWLSPYGVMLWPPS